MNNISNLRFPLANMVAVSSNEQTSNAVDFDRGFEIYFQGAADRQPDAVNNSSSSVQMNQPLDFTTPEIRSDPGSQSGTQTLPSQRSNSRFSDNVNPVQNAESFWIRGENSDQLQLNPAIFPPLAAQNRVPVSAPRQNSRNSPNNRNFPRMNFDPTTNNFQRVRHSPPANSVPPFFPTVPPIAPTLGPLPPTFMPPPSSFLPPPPPPPMAAPFTSPVPTSNLADRFPQAPVDASSPQQTQTSYSYNGGQDFYNNSIFRDAATPLTAPQPPAPSPVQNRRNYNAEQMEFEFRLEEMSNKCDRTNTSLNYTKKENYPQFDHTKDFTTFYNDIENQLIADGLAEFVTDKFLPIDLLDPFQSIDNRVFRNALELKEKMKSVVNKIREIENRALSRLNTLLLHIFFEPQAQDLLRTVAQNCLPHEKFNQIKKLYNSPTLIKEADELEKFHSIHRHKGEPIVDFILRIDSQAHSLASQRNYIVNDKIKIAKVRKAVRGTLVGIAVSAIQKEGASWDSVRQCIIDNKDFDISEHEQNFAGNVKFSKFQDRSRSRSRSQGRERSHSRSPGRSTRATSSRSSFSRDYKETSNRPKDHRSHDYKSKSKSPSRSSSSNHRYQSADRQRGRSPARPYGSSSFGRSDHRHASSRDRGRSSSANQQRPKKNFASKSDKFPHRQYKHRNFKIT